MALWDSADCLLRLKRVVAQPAVSEVPAPDTALDTFYYELLTEAQVFWTNELAAHVPDLAGLYTFEQLTSSDGGVSYDFTTEPLGHYEIRQSRNGRLLSPAAEWDPGGDFVPDGKKIRFPGGKSKQFTSGPWARYVKTPGLLNAATQPTLQPPQARQLVVYHAAGLWAVRGGQRDPQPFWDLEARHAFGDPGTGSVGLVGSLKQSAFLAGGAANPAGGWWP